MLQWADDYNINKRETGDPFLRQAFVKRATLGINHHAFAATARLHRKAEV